MAACKRMMNTFPTQVVDEHILTQVVPVQIMEKTERPEGLSVFSNISEGEL